MSLNGVIASFATGTYVVTRRRDDGVYVDGERTLPIEEDEVVVSAVSFADDEFTSVGHGLITGDGPFRLVPEDDTLPSGLSIDTSYWVILVDVDTFMLALSEADATAEVAVDVTDAGVGTFALSTSRFQAEMCIQPLVGKDLDAVPEANRTSDMKLVFCGEPLLTHMPTHEADSVHYKGEDWTVTTSSEWEHWGETHWRCSMGRDEET